MKNPKVDGSGIIDAIPQTGKCPNDCESCFYNKRFYRTLDEPLIPSRKEARGRIVRMNSGHDSNFNKALVLRIAKRYKDVFFNTSIENLDFPNPVVLTVNPITDTRPVFIEIPKNLMMVRVRANLWNSPVITAACSYYGRDYKIPTVLTWMRYNSLTQIPKRYHHHYHYQKHLLNEYYALSNEMQADETLKWQRNYPNIKLCGDRHSSLCSSCGTCLTSYYQTKERMKT